MSRRTALKTSALALTWAACGAVGFCDDSPGTKELLDYLEGLKRSDGGYGWEGQERSHLTPTFAVMGCYHVLGKAPPRQQTLIEFVRTHHPSQLKSLEQPHHEFEYQQMQTLVWLGAEVAEFLPVVRGWTHPAVYLKQYERHGYPIFVHEVAAFTCRQLLGLAEIPQAHVEYLDSRRRANGSFNNTPAEDGAEGHVVNTWHGLRALQVICRTHERADETIHWLRACQTKSGGFAWQPKAPFAKVADASCTWAAVRALSLLGSTPSEPQRCIEFLLSLGNVDGGFADQPGWQSNPLATYYVLDALSALAKLSAACGKRRPRSGLSRTLPKDLKVFSLQIEAHGQGSPAEAVELARSLRIHLWGAKNSKPGWITRAQAIAREQGVPVTFFRSDEEYGTWVRFPGFGTYSHTSDLIAPANAAIGTSLSAEPPVDWAQFRKGRLQPLEEGRGRLIWQFGENECLVRSLLNDSVQRGGYAAISTFHFGNPDFTNSEPWLHSFQGQIPFVALQDAHGPEPWWFADMTTGFRTLFLAAEPTWEGWLEALEKKWVAAVRRDRVTRFETWMHCSSHEVGERMKEHGLAWRWWDNPEIERPMVSIVAVRPTDLFEVGRPQTGVNLRIRCARQNTTQGRPGPAIAELDRLTIDGVEKETTLVITPEGKVPQDYCHLAALPELSGGTHEAVASVRLLADGKKVSRRLRFDV